MLASLPLVTQEPLGAADDINLYSLEKERGLGRGLAAEFRQRTTPIDSPTVQSYLDRLGQGIVRQLRGTKFLFTFSVIADDPCRTIHEPTSLPGGYVFVPAALFLAAHDEAEFAGMLAHAMEHIAQRHGTRQAARGQIANLSSVPLIFMGGWSGNCSEGLVLPKGFLAIQRSNDLEADALAVQTMARAGFDPMALVRYIERVQHQPTTVTQKAAVGLPDREQRLAAMRSIIEKLPPANYAAPTEDFATVQKELRRLMESRVLPKAPPSLKRSNR